MSLAWWHNYKWATKMICKVFSSDFFVPLYHHLFPDRQCNIAMLSHTSIVTFCNYIRLAYPTFREQLRQSLTGQLSTRQRVLLTNLTDLCEFFIPVVSFIYIIVIVVILCVFVLYLFFGCVYIDVYYNMLLGLSIIFICICMYCILFNFVTYNLCTGPRLLC